MTNRIEVISPFSSIVEAVLVMDGALVEAGNPIIKLDHLDEMMELDRAEHFKRTLELSLERYTGGENADQLKLFTLGIGVAEEYERLTERILHEFEVERRVGIKTYEVEIARAEFAEAKAKKSKANVLLDIYKRNVSQNVEMIQIGLAHAEKVIGFAKAKIAQTYIVAPISGTIELNISKGSFARAGGVVARVERAQ